MIRSQFIRDIISLLLDGDDEYILIRKQADWITEENFKYTGHGVFVHFKLEEQTLKYRLDMKDFWLNGVLIKSDEIDIAAEATFQPAIDVILPRQHEISLFNTDSLSLNLLLNSFSFILNLSSGS